MTFRIKKGDHGVLSLSNVGRANIVVSYWRRRKAKILPSAVYQAFCGGMICTVIRVFNQAFVSLLYRASESRRTHVGCPLIKKQTADIYMTSDFLLCLHFLLDGSSNEYTQT